MGPSGTMRLRMARYGPASPEAQDSEVRPVADHAVDKLVVGTVDQVIETAPEGSRVIRVDAGLAADRPDPISTSGLTSR
jgi:hypothetical protein